MSDDARARALKIDRFMRLPCRKEEVWQGGGVALPLFAPDERTGEPVRQAATAWANLATGDVVLTPCTLADAASHAFVLESLIDFGLKRRKVREGRPSRLEVLNAALGAYIKDALGDPALEIAVVSALPSIDEEVDGIIGSEDAGTAAPSVLDGHGVTIERLRAFADAASRFYGGAPWDTLDAEDLVLVEAPEAPAGMEALTLLPAERGIAFFDRQAASERVGSDHDDEEHDDEEDEEGERSATSWHLEFVRLHELPVRDVNAWADFGLPVAADDAFPVVIRTVPGGTFERADAERLAFLEGLLRALTGTPDSEIDSGRWSRTVETADGPVEYRLALPGLLDIDDEKEADSGRIARFAIEGGCETTDEVAARLSEVGSQAPEFPPPATVEERARERVYRAMAVSGRRQAQLLAEALSIWPDCYEARMLLAERRAGDPAALRLFEEARAAAERALGAEALAANRGRYWDEWPTRTYQRIRFGLAATMREMGRDAEATAAFAELLDLDAEDHAGARDYLLGLLLEQGRDSEAADLLTRFDVDAGSPTWGLGLVLLAYRQGDRKRAAAVLQAAVRRNPLAPVMLVAEILGEDRAAGLPRPRRVAHETEDDGHDAVDLLSGACKATPGAAEWMAGQLRRRR